MVYFFFLFGCFFWPLFVSLLHPHFISFPVKYLRSELSPSGPPLFECVSSRLRKVYEFWNLLVVETCDTFSVGLLCKSVWRVGVTFLRCKTSCLKTFGKTHSVVNLSIYRRLTGSVFNNQDLVKVRKTYPCEVRTMYVSLTNVSLFSIKILSSVKNRFWYKTVITDSLTK